MSAIKLMLVELVNVRNGRHQIGKLWQDHKRVRVVERKIFGTGLESLFRGLAEEWAISWISSLSCHRFTRKLAGRIPLLIG